MARLPDFYSPQRIGTLFYPDVATIAAQAQAASLPPAQEDAVRVLLLIVDMQVDFCHESGSLYVPGALGDIRRLVEFLYRHAERISHITCSLDSHLPFQIFHAAWWVDARGEHPAPFTLITKQDVEQGKWRPVFKPEWSTWYVQELERGAKKQLTIWPYHVLMGAPGNALDPELWSAVFWHSIARQTQPTWWIKGNISRTEHYSILKPEIEVPEEPTGTLNLDFVESLAAYDFILIAGEAASHCVLETVQDLVEILTPEQLGHVLFLQDCTSPVLHPEIDFQAIAQQQFQEFARRGLQLVNSTDQMPF